MNPGKETVSVDESPLTAPKRSAATVARAVQTAATSDEAFVELPVVKGPPTRRRPSKVAEIPSVILVAMPIGFDLAHLWNRGYTVTLSDDGDHFTVHPALPTDADGDSLRTWIRAVRPEIIAGLREEKVWEDRAWDDQRAEQHIVQFWRDVVAVQKVGGTMSDAFTVTCSEVDRAVLTRRMHTLWRATRVALSSLMVTHSGDDVPLCVVCSACGRLLDWTRNRMDTMCRQCSVLHDDPTLWNDARMSAIEAEAHRMMRDLSVDGSDWDAAFAMVDSAWGRRDPQDAVLACHQLIMLAGQTKRNGIVR